jgi:hypothetical protein
MIATAPLIVDHPSTRLGRAAAVSITQPAKGNKAPDQPTRHARAPPESTSSSRCARFGPANRPAPSELSSSSSPYPSNIFFAINALIDKALLAPEPWWLSHPLSSTAADADMHGDIGSQRQHTPFGCRCTRYRHRDLLAVAVHPLKHSTFGRIARQL